MLDDFTAILPVPDRFVQMPQESVANPSNHPPGARALRALKVRPLLEMAATQGDGRAGEPRRMKLPVQFAGGRELRVCLSFEWSEDNSGMRSQTE